MLQHLHHDLNEIFNKFFFVFSEKALHSNSVQEMHPFY